MVRLRWSSRRTSLLSAAIRGPISAMGKPNSSLRCDPRPFPCRRAGWPVILLGWPSPLVMDVSYGCSCAELRSRPCERDDSADLMLAAAPAAVSQISAASLQEGFLAVFTTPHRGIDRIAPGWMHCSIGPEP